MITDLKDNFSAGEDKVNDYHKMLSISVVCIRINKSK